MIWTIWELMSNQWDSFVGGIHASHPAALGSILGVPQKISEKKLIWWRWDYWTATLLWEWTMQSLIVDWTHLVLASGKLVQEKKEALLMTKR